MLSSLKTEEGYILKEKVDKKGKHKEQKKEES